MAANIWSCSTYEIYTVEQKSDATEYKVTLQRLPASNYLEKTYYFLPANEPDDSSGLIKFPSNLSRNDFLANVLPSVNSYITALDAESFTTIT
jgi:hypothetical protein